MSVQMLCPFLNWVFFFCGWILGVLHIFWILISYQIYDLQILSPILWVAFYTLLILSFNAHNGLEMFTPGKTEVQRGCVFCLRLHWIICVMLKHSVMVTGRISHLPPHLIQQPWSCLYCRWGNWKGWVLPRVTLGSVAEFDLKPEGKSRTGVRQLGVESWCCHLLTVTSGKSVFLPGDFIVPMCEMGPHGAVVRVPGYPGLDW